jgi:hypothetical protein
MESDDGKQESSFEEDEPSARKKGLTTTSTNVTRT